MQNLRCHIFTKTLSPSQSYHVTIIPLHSNSINVSYILLSSSSTSSSFSQIYSKPSLFTLYWCMIADMLIWSTFLWFFIKMCQIFVSWSNHCDEYLSKYDKFYDEDSNSANIAANVYKDGCNFDDICEWTINKWEDEDSYGCYRTHDNNYTLFCSWCVFWTVIMIIDLSRCGFVCCPTNGYQVEIICQCCIDKINSSGLLFFDADVWRTFMFIFKCCDDCKEPLFIDDYNKRQLWTYANAKGSLTIFLLALDCFLRWGFHIIFSIIYYVKYDHYHVGDFSIEWYEIWSALLLLMMKYCVEIIHSKGIPYNEEIEQYRFDRYQTKMKYDFMYNMYGLRQDILQIIFEFSDEYYPEIQTQNSLIKDLCVCCNVDNQRYILMKESSNEDDEYLEMTDAQHRNDDRIYNEEYIDDNEDMLTGRLRVDDSEML